MKALVPSVLALAALALFFPTPVLHAGPVVTIPASSCAPDFSGCDVYENQPTLFPFCCGISGDVVIQSGANTIGVFRIFNDAVDTGGGTGLGLSGFLYSATFYNLPAPSTYSVNAAFIPLGPELPNGFNRTVFNGNGTIYNIFTLAPEPSTLGLLAIGGLLVAWRRRLAR